nr:DUF5681 domain-containing protein [uncultured Rhodoblastus sp.]
MAETTGRKQRGAPFQRGRSGNPAGRPQGARHKATMLAEKMMEDDAAEIVKAVIAAARSGDMTAAKIIIDRIAPLRRGRPVRLDLPPVESASDVATATAALVAAMGAGEVTPDEAMTIASVFELRRRALESEEFEQRLLALEGQKR